MQGSGACKRSLDGKTNSPHYGGYTTHAVESGDPPHGVIVVVVAVVVVAVVVVGGGDGGLGLEKLVAQRDPN